MSKAIEVEEYEENDYFHDSLDRLLSSTHTSCSSSSSPSEDEYEDRDPRFNLGSPNYAISDPLKSVPKSPMGVLNNYDVWISEPSSIEERRFRLFRQMGLSLRSVSSLHLKCQTSSSSISSKCSVSGIVRSKLDGDSNSSSFPSCSSVHKSSEILCVNDSDSIVVHNNGNVDQLHNGNGSAVVAVRADSRDNDSCNLLENGEVEEEDDDLESNGDVEIEETACTIKDLDNGKKFVINEVREDGMWNKLKEVSTGKQLTMEEFDVCVGTSPIVQELMRRQNVEDGNDDDNNNNNNINLDNMNGIAGAGLKTKKRGSWLKSIRNVASSVTGHKERRSSDERDTSSEKGGQRSSSATDDSQDGSLNGPERVRARQYGKSSKELTAVYKIQEIQAHNGSIWTIRFSLDGKFLASAGEDRVIHVRKVTSSERKGDLLLDKREDGNLNLLFSATGSPEPTTMSPNFDGHFEKKRRGRSSISRKSIGFDHVLVPETVFALSEKPICSFEGHLDDVLDISWSKSEQLLSSSMDKTVRLWELSSKSCLKIFSHSDYVTCIQFNPVDDRYFISGSLDSKVRIWSIPQQQVVDWNDLHEMVTAACYTPDGQGAFVGSYKGSCHLYNTSDNKLLQKAKINLQNKKKKTHQRKITGFQFVPGTTSQVLITSADSRIRVVDGADLVHKFKGFRNTSKHISASVTADARYVVCASEDSHVYIWKHENDSRPSRNKGVTITQSYEHFHSQDVSVAIPWPGMLDTWRSQTTSSGEQSHHVGLDEVSTANHPPSPVEENGSKCSPLTSGCSNSPLHRTISSATNNYFFDRISATWPEEKLLRATKYCSPRVSTDSSIDFSSGLIQTKSCWGLVIVTASHRGEIRTFQNFGLPIRF